MLAISSQTRTIPSNPIQFVAGLISIPCLPACPPVARIRRTCLLAPAMRGKFNPTDSAGRGRGRGKGRKKKGRTAHDEASGDTAFLGPDQGVEGRYRTEWMHGCRLYGGCMLRTRSTVNEKVIRQLRCHYLDFVTLTQRKRREKKTETR